MNDINEMPPKCQYCPYWEVCKYPWVRPDKSDLQPTCNQIATDRISRQAAIDAVKDRYYIYDRFAKVEELVWAIEDLPSAQPERKRGKWKPYRCDMYECSECGYIYTELTDRHRCGANFCPHCGAKMEVSE